MVFPMSRQKKTRGIPPLFLVAVLAAVAVAGYFFMNRGGGESSLRTTEELDPALYYDNANSLRGNTYKIDAEIDSALGNSPSKGRIFSVVLKKDAKSGAPVVLPILVPVELGALTIQKGQRYLMRVKVIDNGLLKVEEARKP
jgi:hypothetical protein